MRKITKERLQYAVAVCLAYIFYAPETLKRWAKQPFALLILMYSFVPSAIILYIVYSLVGLLIFFSLLLFQTRLATWLSAFLCEVKQKQNLNKATDHFIDLADVAPKGAFLFN